MGLFDFLKGKFQSPVNSTSHDIGQVRNENSLTTVEKKELW